jgi:Acetyltransferase (GNAT) family
MIREITAADKSRVIEICSQIWEGDDYIPQVFDDWIKDDGVFAGLWENDVLVGFGKLTWLSPTDVWLEGLRKDEKTGARNVGEKLSKYYLNYLKGKKIYSVSFSTYFGNTASIILNEKLGFRKILEQSLKTKKLEKSIRKTSDKICTDIDFPTFKKYVENSKYLHASKGNIYKGWVVHKYSEELLQEYYNNKSFAVWMENQKIKGCVLWSEVNYQKVFWLSFLEAANESIFIDLLQYVINLNQSNCKTEIEILVPTLQLLELCNRHGFTSWEKENDFYLYELPHEIIDQITNF